MRRSLRATAGHYDRRVDEVHTCPLLGTVLRITFIDFLDLVQYIFVIQFAWLRNYITDTGLQKRRKMCRIEERQTPQGDAVTASPAIRILRLETYGRSPVLDPENRQGPKCEGMVLSHDIHWRRSPRASGSSEISPCWRRASTFFRRALHRREVNKLKRLLAASGGSIGWSRSTTACGVAAGACLFHLDDRGFKNRTILQNRTEKAHRVRDSRAHAALAYDGSAAVGWCQFGPTDELPRFKHKRAYFSGLIDPPDWRIKCFFVDRDYRCKGVASVALKGAPSKATLRTPQVGQYQRPCLYNGTVSMFEREGFKRSRRLGKNHWVVTKVVRKSSRKKLPAQR
jgi:hypothetical protein